MLSTRFSSLALCFSATSGFGSMIERRAQRPRRPLGSSSTFIESCGMLAKAVGGGRRQKSPSELQTLGATLCCARLLHVRLFVANVHETWPGQHRRHRRSMSRELVAQFSLCASANEGRILTRLLIFRFKIGLKPTTWVEAAIATANRNQKLQAPFFSATR